MTATIDTPPSAAAGTPLTVEDKAEMDDERRDLPQGWIRAFDRASKHHFYVNTSDANRAQWLNPWDDPSFLSTLPDTHPAKPTSEAAVKARTRARDDEVSLHSATTAGEHGLKGSAEPAGKDRRGSWFSGIKDKVTQAIDGESPQAAMARTVREMEDAYRKRRQVLAEGKTTDKTIKKLYAADPFAYTAPTEPFDRPAAATDNTHQVFGYSGGWGQRYSPAYGYSRVALQKDESALSRAYTSLLIGQPVAGYDKKTNYGFSG